MNRPVLPDISENTLDWHALMKYQEEWIAYACEMYEQGISVGMDVERATKIESFLDSTGFCTKETLNDNV